MKFCSACGAPVAKRVPPGDKIPRHCCDVCGAIHYLNPRMVVGALPVWDDRVLLCRRGIEPRLGHWTLPAGFMENAETTGEAAVRETLEEACARVELGPMYTLTNVAQINQVHILYRARLLDLDFRAGDETLEVALFAEDEVPWERIAFRSVLLTLQHYFNERPSGRFGFHVTDVSFPVMPDHTASS